MQAVVLVGGRASRLRAQGVKVPLSKSFMKVSGQPLLYWNLLSMYKAGVRKLIIVGDEVRYLYFAKKVIRELFYNFDDVIYFCDEGNGVHGVLYELRYLLEKVYIFECGHGLSKPDHYKKLVNANKKYEIVFSGYNASKSNMRQPVILMANGRVSVSSLPGQAVAHPIVAGKTYAQRLLRLRFNIQNIIKTYSADMALGYVKNELPPEYDVKEEMINARKVYSDYLSKI